jgi:hypothetical protein
MLLCSSSPLFLGLVPPIRSLSNPIPVFHACGRLVPNVSVALLDINWGKNLSDIQPIRERNTISEQIYGLVCFKFYHVMLEVGQCLLNYEAAFV